MDQDEDDFLMALALYREVLSAHNGVVNHAAHNMKLHEQAQSVQRNDVNDRSDEECEGEGPGRGNPVSSMGKAPYMRRNHRRRYEDVRYDDTDPDLFEKVVHLSREEFDALHIMCEEELRKPLNVRCEYDQGDHLVPRRKRLTTEELLFLFFEMVRGGNEGGQGVEFIAYDYGVSPGIISNYFRHCCLALFRTLDAVEPRLIRCPAKEEREEVHGLLLDFPRCVFLVDGYKNRRWRPLEEEEQEWAYDGYKKTHAFSVIVFCDLHGNFTRIEISDKGAESDRVMFTSSEVYKNPEIFLSEEEHGMADMGFAGDGALVVPYKRTESTEWIYRSEHNCAIRSTRMVNKWGIGYINNRHRLFLGRWIYEKDLFPFAYKAVAMIANWRFRRRGYALQTRKYYEDRIEREMLSDDSN